MLLPKYSFIYIKIKNSIESLLLFMISEEFKKKKLCPNFHCFLDIKVNISKSNIFLYLFRWTKRIRRRFRSNCLEIRWWSRGIRWTVYKSTREKFDFRGNVILLYANYLIVQVRFKSALEYCTILYTRMYNILKVNRVEDIFAAIFKSMIALTE